jgi:hypothetical protein
MAASEDDDAGSISSGNKSTKTPGSKSVSGSARKNSVGKASPVDGAPDDDNASRTRKKSIGSPVPLQKLLRTMIPRRGMVSANSITAKTTLMLLRRPVSLQRRPLERRGSRPLQIHLAIAHHSVTRLPIRPTGGQLSIRHKTAMTTTLPK